MELHDIQTLKRVVRRDPSISDGACRLFAEIADMHALEGGCYVKDEKLGTWVGCSARTVRRRKRELETAGYLTIDHQNGRRYLVPTAEVDKTDRTDLADKTDQPDNFDGQNWPNDRTHLSNTDKIDRTNLSNTERYNIPPSGDNPRESAPARVRAVLVEELDTDFPGQQLTRDELAQIVARAGPKGLEILRGVCQEFERRDWSPNLPTIIKRFKRQIKDLDHDRSNPNPSNKSNGRAVSPSGYDYDQHLEPAR